MPDQSFDPYADNYYNSPIDSTPSCSNSTRYDSLHRHEYNTDAQLNTPIGYNATAKLDASLPTHTSPTEEYIFESQKPSTRINDPSSSRKLLVLDLNGTLLFRSPHARRGNRPRPQWSYRDSNGAHQLPFNPDPSPYANPNILRPLRPVHRRPYLTSFREYLFHPKTRVWLDTMVWSSAQPHSVEDMVEKCFGGKKDELVAVWARDTLDLDEKSYHRKTQTTKDLAKPWAALPISQASGIPSTTESPREHSAHTTLLLDDSPRKARLQPWNHLCIREYVEALWNNDIVRYAAEKNRQNNDVQHTHYEKLEAPVSAGPELLDTAMTTAATVESSDAEIQVGNKKQRKRLKKQKMDSEFTSLANAVGTEGFEGMYDQTLLAVIGVLDTIKYEDNVAGWIRSGGICSNPNIIERRKGKEIVATDVDYQTSKARMDPVDTGASSDHYLKRKHLFEGESRQRREDIIELPVSGQKANGVGQAMGNSEQEEWYEDPLIMRHWVQRGIHALDELGIKVVVGISY